MVRLIMKDETCYSSVFLTTKLFSNLFQPTDPHAFRIKFHHSIINAAGQFFIDVDAHI
jgi:hypothetical protein